MAQEVTKIEVHAIVRYDDYAPSIESAIHVVAIVPTADEADREIERLNSIRRGRSRYFRVSGPFFPQGRGITIGY